MNRDDESFLSAYLDGELDPEERALVESAVLSDAELAEKLRGIGSVREMVSSVNRDLPVNVASRVMDRIHLKRILSAQERPRHMWLRAARQSPRAALIAGVAATLLLSVTLALPLLMSRSGPEPFRRVANGGVGPLPLRPGAADAPGAQRGRGELLAPDADQPLDATAERTAASSSLDGATRRAVAGTTPGVTRTVRSGALEHYRQLLDNAHERRLFRISDTGDGKASQQAASVVEGATQFGFYKITIAQGIVIDPRHPEEATVYVALVSAKGLDALRNRLAEAAPDRVEESEVDPGVVTQLADMGQVHGFKSAPFGDVLIPHGGLALKEKPGEAGPEEMAPEDENDLAPPDRPKVEREPTIEQERSAPIGELFAKQVASRGGSSHESIADRVSKSAAPARGHAGPGAPAGAPASNPGVQTPPAAAPGPRRRKAIGDTFVVLVWVERSGRG